MHRVGLAGKSVIQLQRQFIMIIISSRSGSSSSVTISIIIIRDAASSKIH